MPDTRPGSWPQPIPGPAPREDPRIAHQSDSLHPASVQAPYFHHAAPYFLVHRGGARDEPVVRDELNRMSFPDVYTSRWVPPLALPGALTASGQHRYRLFHAARGDGHA